MGIDPPVCSAGASTKPIITLTIRFAIQSLMSFHTTNTFDSPAPPLMVGAHNVSQSPVIPARFKRIR